VDLKKIEKALIARLQEIEQKMINRQKEHFSNVQVQDPGDQALSSTMETLRTSLQDTEAEEFKRITRAIEKIKDGSYGICIDCNGEISEKRLISFPDATRCLLCQELFEEQSKE
jgi:DnaK suppressor protein